MLARNIKYAAATTAVRRCYAADFEAQSSVAVIGDQRPRVTPWRRACSDFRWGADRYRLVDYISRFHIGGLKHGSKRSSCKNTDKKKQGEDTGQDPASLFASPLELLTHL